MQPKVLEIISEFIDEDKNNYKQLQNNLSSYKIIFQYVYSNIFRENYCSTEKRGFDLKSNSRIIFKTYKDKNQFESSLGKNSINYESISDKTNIHKQKPINIDQFNKIKVAEVKERIKKRKQKRRELQKKTNFKKKGNVKTQKLKKKICGSVWLNSTKSSKR